MIHINLELSASDCSSSLTKQQPRTLASPAISCAPRFALDVAFYAILAFLDRVKTTCLLQTLLLYFLFLSLRLNNRLRYFGA